MKTDLGLDLKSNFWYGLRIKQDLEDLVRRIQHAATVGRRIASRIPLGLGCCCLWSLARVVSS